MNLFGLRKKNVKSRTICLCHDVERGMGHVIEDPAFSTTADRDATAFLEQMLAIEKEVGVIATYNVVGSFLHEVRDQISSGGHCLAFHSYDHGTALNQLERCRQVDSMIKGYRPAKSILTPELTTQNLRAFQFEWLASSVSSLGTSQPQRADGILKIPIAFDDFAMYQHKMRYEDWEKTALHRIQESSFIAFSLHDCYGSFWLPYYGQFLKKVSRLGAMRTLDEIADGTKDS